MPLISSVVAAFSPSVRTYGADETKVKVVIGNRRLKLMAKIDEKTGGRFFDGAAEIKRDRRSNANLLYGRLSVEFGKDNPSLAKLYNNITKGKAKNIEANYKEWGVRKTPEGYELDRDKALTLLSLADLYERASNFQASSRGVASSRM